MVGVGVHMRLITGTFFIKHYQAAVGQPSYKGITSAEAVIVTSGAVVRGNLPHCRGFTIGRQGCQLVKSSHLRCSGYDLVTRVGPGLCLCMGSKRRQGQYQKKESGLHMEGELIGRQGSIKLLFLFSTCVQFMHAFKWIGSGNSGVCRNR